MLRDRVAAIRRSERRLEDRYVLALFLIIGCIVTFAWLGGGRFGRVLAVTIQGVTLIVILRASHSRPRTIRVAGVALVVSLVAVGLASTTDGRAAHAAPFVLGAALALAAPIAILHHLRHEVEISFMTVAGALCIYLLAGLFFALLYGSIGAIADPFFVQKQVANGVDYVYFSFVTLTTVGYGDLTARQDVGRMCSILEALFGQLYLVVVVALLVSNIGRPRRHPSGVTPDAQP